ncbi:ABC transporter substrate-binding protein [Candidatus Phytoplasma australiense]|uniref:Periplasmic dipeptide transport protein n=1 Tax=Strawberry lethal yellows phytoplasma (CPA) str. NZSb11 TaxID=980422 RepID=R4RXF6_PHYAS|nr:ABC transporter substrate-binding protein [Candidatus Phytoplasma australiense]AGL90572.1 Periplasmic dipeptide transport protein precursor [Strawberry lethal yellows phytoplasma (CPA) str. NZSb11]
MIKKSINLATVQKLIIFKDLIQERKKIKMNLAKFKAFCSKHRKAIIYTSLLFLIIFVITITAIIVRKGNKKAFDPNTVNITMPSDVKGFDVCNTSHTSTAYANWAFSLMHDTLLYKNKKGEVKSMLATLDEKDSEGKRFTFTLKDKILFHNGKLLTTDDIVFTFERGKANEHAQFLEIEAVEKIDAKKFIIVVKDASLWSNFKFYSFFKVLSKQTIQEAQNQGDEAIQKALQVGTGPYKLVDYNKDDRLKFELFDSYYDKERIKTSPQKINLKISKNDDTNLQELENGQIDAILNYPNSKIKDVKQNLSNKIKIVENDSVGCSYIYINKKTTSLEARKAISQTIDTQAIKDQLELPGKKLNSFLPTSLIGSDLALKYDINLSEAKNIVNNLSSNQKKLKIGISIGNPLDVAGKVVEQLRNVGFEVNLNQEDFNSLTKNMIKEDTDYNMIFLGENHELEYGHKALTDYFFSNNNESNFCHIDNNDQTSIEDKLKLAQKELNKGEYISLIQQVSKYIHQQVYVIPLYTSPSYCLTSKHIEKGFETDAFSNFEFTTIIKKQ